MLSKLLFARAPPKSSRLSKPPPKRIHRLRYHPKKNPHSSPSIYLAQQEWARRRFNQGLKSKVLAAYEDCVQGDATKEQLSWTHSILIRNPGVNPVFKSLNWSFLFLFYRTCVPLPPCVSIEVKVLFFIRY